jgi:hypothetical protein
MRQSTDNRDQIEYITGLAEFERLACDRTFLDFVGMYDDAGSHAESGTVSFSTSDPEDAALAAHWIRRLSGSRVGYVLDFEPGQDVVEMVRFWAGRLGIGHDQLRLRRAGFREEVIGFRAAGFDEHGVFTVRSTDPILRIRLQAWMDKSRANLVRAGW